MWFLLAVCGAFLFGSSGFLLKIGVERRVPTRMLLFGLYAASSIGFLLFAVWQGGGVLDWSAFVSGAAIGAGAVFGDIYFMRALQSGPASLVSPLANSNLILVALFSIIVYGEKLSLIEGLGVVLLIAAIAVVNARPGESPDSIESSWPLLLIACILFLALRNTGLKVITEMGIASSAALFYAHLFGASWFGQQYRLARNRPGAPKVTASLPETGLGIAAGLLASAGLFLYAESLKLGPASIVASVFAINSLVVVAGSMVVYKERLSPLQLSALAGAIVGMILVNN